MTILYIEKEIHTDFKILYNFNNLYAMYVEIDVCILT